MSRLSPGSPSKWMATRSPRPAATWRSRQLTATFNSPSSNHFANGGCSLIEGSFGDGLGGEFGARAEAPDLLECVIDLNGHGSPVAPSRLRSSVGSPAPPAPYRSLVQR